jgi:hypothetical protein
MAKFKNISKRPISIIHAGRKINIKPGQFVDGPPSFGMYSGLKEMTEEEVSKQTKAAAKVIKYKGPSQAKAVVSPSIMKNYMSTKGAPEAAAFVEDNKQSVLGENKNRVLTAKKFAEEYPKNKKTKRVAICLTGTAQKCKDFSEILDLKSSYKNYKIYHIDGDGKLFPSTSADSLEKIDADFIITHSASEPVVNDYVSTIAKYGIVNIVNLPKVYKVKHLSTEKIIQDIKANYVVKNKVCVTVATLTHNIGQYTTFLDDLSKQRTDKTFEVIVLPNYNNEYKSCAEALNVAKMLANGTVCVLCHQDLRLPSGWIHNIMRHADALDNTKVPWGVLGMAGASKLGSQPSPQSQYNVIYLSDKVSHNDTIATFFRKAFGTRKEVQCVDELCLIMKQDLPVWFDEQVCDHYHWYGADICLASLHAGFKNFAIDAECLHLSNGQENLSSGHAQMYVDHAVKVFKKWSKHFDYWQTTTGVFMSKEKVFIPTIFILINRNKSKEKKLPELVRIT